MGDGRLQVLDGGYASVTGNMTVGGTMGQGTVVVDGDSDLVIVGGDLLVGAHQYGTVTVSGGSTLTVDGGNGDIVMGNGSAGATLTIGTDGGTIDANVVRFVNSSSQLKFDHGLSTYTFDTALSGDGDIVNLSGSTLLRSDVSSAVPSAVPVRSPA